MTRNSFFQSFSLSLRKYGKWFLAICWFIGMLFGIGAGRNASDFLIPTMRSAAVATVSIPGLLVASALPFLLSAYAVSISEPWLLLIISAYKAFGFSFCAFAVSLTFGQSGWLVRFLFLFSDHCLIPVLYLYWLRHISGERTFSFWEAVAVTAVAVLIGCIDYYLISPFLATLI